jgi:hypothetical protein
MPHGWERRFVITLSGGDSPARSPIFRVTASDGTLAVEEMNGPAASGGAGSEPDRDQYRKPGARGHARDSKEVA